MFEEVLDCFRAEACVTAGHPVKSLIRCFVSVLVFDLVLNALQPYITVLADEVK
jgi:hypothetical protein